MSQPLLCIYHANCADGFGAAWAVRSANPTAEFHAAGYGSAPPPVADREVIIVDFSYPRDALIAMAAEARSIVVLDHHASAEKDLVDLPVNVAAHFDMSRSGAMLAWNYCWGPLVRLAPELLRHIEDRDLWKFYLPQTRTVMAALFSYPQDFDVWDALMQRPVDDLAAEGAIIERKHAKDVADLVVATRRRIIIAGHEVPVANLPHIYASDAGHLMSHGEAFAACYWDTVDARHFSLRSQPEGLDVSEIARTYGGGGHKHAAGFRVPRGHGLATW
jgi:uncharacterized protein